MYLSDRYVFNNPDSEWSKQEIEYLLVGDSFTFGECLDRPNDIASILRVKSKKSVLNLGYGSNGPLLYYATLREYLNSNVNNVLILFHEGSDLINLTEELENKILRNYLNDINFSQNLKSIQNKIDQMAFDIINEHKNALIKKTII